MDCKVSIFIQIGVGGSKNENRFKPMISINILLVNVFTNVARAQGLLVCTISLQSMS